MAFQAGVQVVVLPGAAVDAVAAADHRLIVKAGRRPGETKARIEVAVVGEEERAALWTDPRVVGDGVGATLDVEDSAAAVRLADGSIVFPAQAHVQREV